VSAVATVVAVVSVDAVVGIVGIIVVECISEKLLIGSFSMVLICIRD
jgi:hypothetical protein